MVKVTDFAGTAGVRGADQLPEPVIGIVSYQQDRLVALDHFKRLDAVRTQQPMPHPPRSSITLHDPVRDPPYEREVLVGPGLVRRQIRTALRNTFERFIDKRERVATLMLEHHRVKRTSAWIAGPYPDRQPCDMRLRPGDPAECVRGEFAPNANELAKCSTIHPRELGNRHLDEGTLQHLTIHAANLTMPTSREKVATKY